MCKDDVRSTLNSYATVQRSVFLRAHDQGQIYKHQQPKKKVLYIYTINKWTQKRNTSKTSCMLMPNGFYISSVIFGCCIMFIQAVLLTLTVRNAQFGFMFPLSLSFITSFPCATALFIFSQLCGGFMNISYICVSFQFFCSCVCI